MPQDDLSSAEALPGHVASTDRLGPSSERAAFEAAMARKGYHQPPALYRDGTYRDTCYAAGWDAWQEASERGAAAADCAAAAAVRHVCAAALAGATETPSRGPWDAGFREGVRACATVVCACFESGPNVRAETPTPAQKE